MATFLVTRPALAVAGVAISDPHPCYNREPSDTYSAESRWERRYGYGSDPSGRMLMSVISNSACVSLHGAVVAERNANLTWDSRCKEQQQLILYSIDRKLSHTM